MFPSWFPSPSTRSWLLPGSTDPDPVPIDWEVHWTAKNAAYGWSGNVDPPNPPIRTLQPDHRPKVGAILQCNARQINPRTVSRRTFKVLALCRNPEKQYNARYKQFVRVVGYDEEGKMLFKPVGPKQSLDAEESKSLL